MEKSELQVGQTLILDLHNGYVPLTIKKIARHYLETECARRVDISTGQTRKLRDKKQFCGICFINIQEMEQHRLSVAWRLFRNQMHYKSFDPPKDLTIESLNQAMDLIFGAK